MKFDTLLKVGSYVADIWKHESFQQMSRMVHKGVKRRMQSYGPETFHHSQRTGPFGHNFENQNLKTPDRAKQPKQAQVKWGDYLTPDNVQSAFQLHQTIKKIFNTKK